jgi:hypothetical protein
MCSVVLLSLFCFSKRVVAMNGIYLYYTVAIESTDALLVAYVSILICSILINTFT